MQGLHTLLEETSVLRVLLGVVSFCDCLAQPLERRGRGADVSGFQGLGGSGGEGVNLLALYGSQLLLCKCTVMEHWRLTSKLISARLNQSVGYGMMV